MPSVGPDIQNFMAPSVFEVVCDLEQGPRTLLVESRTTADGHTTLFTILDERLYALWRKGHNMKG